MTTVYLDLPPTLPAGPAAITISGPDGDGTDTVSVVEITSGQGVPMSDDSVTALERAEHRRVAFTGETVPHAIQVEIAHAHGVGTPWVVAAGSHLVSLVWADDGSSLRVILTPPNGQTVGDLADFAFYISGGVADLKVTKVRAYDVNGAALSDIAATLQ